MFYVYIIKSTTTTLLYTGSTNDLKRRFLEHNNGRVKSTSPHRPFTLIYYEAYLSELDARKRESTLKNSRHSKRYLRDRITNSLQI